MLLILVSASTYSQRIRTIGSDTFVAFTREQAKAINDTFISQKITIKKLKQSDSLYIVKENQYNIQDSTKRVKDSLIYFEQILPALTEIRGLLTTQIETPFKGNFEVGVGGGLSTYFGAYRPFSTIIDGQYYIPSGAGVLRYNFHKHLTGRFEAVGTQVTVGPISKQIVMGTVLADYNIAPNMYSIRVGMIPTVSIGYNIFGITNTSLVVGASLKAYFTARTALEVNIRAQLTDIDQIGNSDQFVWGHLMITRKIK
jgi:hypothetical protein